MKTKKILAALTVAAMTMGLLAGCGSNGSATDTDEFDTSYEISVMTREEGSGTRGAFVELVGIEQKDENGEKVDYTSTEAAVTNSTSVMLSSVAGDEYAIGYV